ncbi:MAG: hypothetical protein BGO55_03370 [Sphingobacteriales bacterium 50-39]|nr:hypothetical protein [Sphingobacteriales bacterium]OJW55594.1 MAG: hypothetical protein BGO55_03370 [Sphingobacteriales bacterium 50-39]
MKRTTPVFRKVTVFELSQSAKDVVIFTLVRLEGDFLDQLGFTRQAPITIYQEGHKLILLREAVDENNKDCRET